MAKLGGTRAQLTDLRQKFALKPGGKVYDLSDKIDFLIVGVDDGSGGIIPKEIISNSFLSLSGQSQTVASVGYRPTGFTLTGTGSVVLSDPNSYPSYLKDEQTVVMYMRANPSGSSSELGGSFLHPHPNTSQTSNGQLSQGFANKYIFTDRLYKNNNKNPDLFFTGSDTRSDVFHRNALKHQFLVTVGTALTSSLSTTVVPFAAGGYYMQSSDEALSGQVSQAIPFFSYKEVIYETNPAVTSLAEFSSVSDNLMSPASDIVAVGFKRDTLDDAEYYENGYLSRNIVAARALNGVEIKSAAFSADVVTVQHPGGRIPLRVPVSYFLPNYPVAVSTGARPLGDPMPMSQVPLSTALKSNNSFRILSFRQRLASDASDGYMSLTVGDVNSFDNGIADIPQSSSRFTQTDRSTYYEKSVDPISNIPSSIRAIGTSPDRMSVGAGHDYVLIAGWRRVLSDDEVQAISLAMTDGVFVSGTTSYTAQILSENAGLQVSNHTFEYSDYGISSAVVSRQTESGKYDSFNDTHIVSSTGSLVGVSIPVVTSRNPNAQGYCFRAHGGSGVGSKAIGFTDSNMNDRVSNVMQAIATAGGELPREELLRVLFAKQNDGFERNPFGDGNVGTGFLYYSPTKKAWIEKRFDQSTSTRDYRGNDIHKFYDEFNQSQGFQYQESFISGTCNVLEYRNNVPLSNTNRSIASFDITGSSKILGQFAGSPNIGYLHPWKETQEVHGYGRIGYPTALWGAPTDQKYHAFDDETIKLSNFIDRPFLLSGIRLNVNVQAGRCFTRLTGTITNTGSPVTVANFANSDLGQWPKYIMNRRDIENYSFFVYRQRRRGGVLKDSYQDISSSERFLIASASICFYNSASFGGSYKDGFWVTASNYFETTKTTNPLYSLLDSEALTQNVLRTIFTSASFGVSSSFGILPNLTTSLGLNCEPIHGPAYSYDWGVDFNHRGSVTHNTSLSLLMKPAVAPVGFTCPTLMTFISGVGPNRATATTWNVPITGVYVAGNLQYYAPLWNHTGNGGQGVTPSEADRYSVAGPGTYAYQVVNYWHGGTRIPRVFVSSSVELQSKTPTTVRNFVRYVGENLTTITASDIPYGAVRQVPSVNFGKKIFDVIPSFSQFTAFDPVDSNRITPREEIGNIISDGRAINCPTINPTRISATNFSLSTSSADFFSIIQPGWWQGIAPVSKKLGPEIRETEYLLLPGDELVLGLESSNFATPDYGPTFITGVYKDQVATYLPTSFMRVVPGIGEIELIGRFVRDNEPYIPQKPSEGSVTSVIGDVPYDQFQVTETDGYYGGIFDEIITGSTDLTSLPYRGVAGHATAGDIKGNFSINRFFTVYTDKYIRDYYDDPVRNTLRSTGSLPGSTTGGYRIPQKAVLSSIHYGYLRDFLETPPYQVLASTERKATFNVPPVIIRFVEKSSTQLENLDEFQKSQTSPLSILGQSTTSQNVNKFARLDGPFKDGQFTDRDELEYTVTV
jgi:hypothetical protein